MSENRAVTRPRIPGTRAPAAARPAPLSPPPQWRHDLIFREPTAPPAEQSDTAHDEPGPARTP
ncbi:hypothetical protein [Streptacidiphilus sp. EB103A]|uniref:hypothetical protein n=1 Tax=Streptacidiphilus sp. EB103A TaxID=3156275 RepID=UPI003518F779